jgi:hypothetical protein
MTRKQARGRRYVITVATDWTEEDSAEYSHVGLDLVEAEPSDKDLAGPAPRFLEHASDLILALGNEMLDSGFVLRLDAPRSANDGFWRSTCTNTSEWQDGLKRLVARLSDSDFRNFYPLTIWGVPNERLDEGIRLVEAFRALPSDEALASDLAVSGVLRLSLFESSATVSAQRELVHVVLQWVRSAEQELGVQLDWDSFA